MSKSLIIAIAFIGISIVGCSTLQDDDIRRLKRINDNLLQQNEDLRAELASLQVAEPEEDTEAVKQDQAEDSVDRGALEKLAGNIYIEKVNTLEHINGPIREIALWEIIGNGKNLICRMNLMKLINPLIPLPPLPPEIATSLFLA